MVTASRVPRPEFDPALPASSTEWTDLGVAQNTGDYFARAGIGASYRNPGEVVSIIAEITVQDRAALREVLNEILERGVDVRGLRGSDSWFILSGQRKALDQLRPDSRIKFSPELPVRD